MRISLLLLAAAALAPAAAAQTTLLSESFETDGDGSRYVVDVEYRTNNANYFLRTNGGNIGNQGNGKYTNADGSFYFAGRNSNAAGNLAEKTVTFPSIDASGFANLQLGFRAGVLDQGVFDNASESENDYLYLQYSTDGGDTFLPCVAFESDATTGDQLQGDLREDTNFDGIGDGALLSTTLTNYSCTIPAGAADFIVQVEFKTDLPFESGGFDLIELIADPVTPPPGDFTGSIAGGTCGPIPFNRPSQTSRCFPQITGTNNMDMEQRYTVFFRIEGTGGDALGFSRVTTRGEIKLGANGTATQKFSLRTKGSDPDGTYDLVLLAAEGSVATPAGADELDRVPFTKGAGAPPEQALRSNEALTAYPNPATDAATLRFSVQQETVATVTVYDALGREVARLVDGTVTGAVEAQLDTASLPAGLYVARLAAEGRTETIRFSVVR